MGYGTRMATSVVVSVAVVGGLLYMLGNESEKPAKQPKSTWHAPKITRVQPKNKESVPKKPRSVTRSRSTPARRQPQKPKPDTTYAYQLPYAKNVSYHVYQGFMTESTHKGSHAVDIAMPGGTPILAARDGVVDFLDDDSEFKIIGMAYGEEYRDRNNSLVIKHDDGTSAVYAHMERGSAKVAVGDSVTAGQEIGICGTAGSPHLHFHVKFTRRMKRRTFSWRWATRDHPEGVTPQEGDYPMRPDSDKKHPENAVSEFFTSTIKNDRKRTFRANERIRIAAHFQRPNDIPVSFRFRRPNSSTIIERQPKASESKRAIWYDIEPWETKYDRGGLWTGYVYLEEVAVDSVNFYVRTGK